ncbi:methionine ABC transporter permease [Sebaldella sp. S0638]|uniref:methionine ABC transporter permease n=1 Tax=Sebaldella sp. S0638 TaxID=2957809 RepID=UPI0020A1497B|nr:methionine ABC transporter permease [Sebaldella sp. S0638]MCP1225987.1 ABC transporter permease [Sebaldella sp. S0638]
MNFSSTRLLEYIPKIIVPALFATLRMLLFSMLISLILGTVIGIILTVTGSSDLKENKKIYNAVSFLVNTIRAFPVIILIVAITPLTKLIAGTSIGEQAAIVPLSIAATPVIARLIQSSFDEVDRNLIIAAKSFGASTMQIVFKVLFVEALPSVISGLTTTTILFLGSITLAGAVGAGGLGAVALTYGYQHFDDAVMYTIVFILCILVFLIQGTGSLLYKKLK